MTKTVLASVAAAVCALGAVAPEVTSLFPHGGQCGSDFEIEIRGSRLEDLQRMEFPDRQLEAKVLSSESGLVRARVRIAADAEAGRHDFRLISPRGTYLGVFWVGTQAETREVAALSLPALVNGQADGADADRFRFHAEAGQTVVFDVNATRGGSALDPVLTLLDERGREIDYCDDFYAFKDARLVHTFRKAGGYTIVVSASFERSAKYASYRLTATGGPFPDSALPLGGTRGQTNSVTVKGWNLGAVDRAWLGKKLVPAEVTGKTSNEVQLRLRIPGDLATGTYQLHLAAGEQEAAMPVRFEVSDLPEITVSGTSAINVNPPVVVNGEIAENGAQWIGFPVQKGSRYEFLVDSWKLGARLDPILTLFDAKNRVLVQEDDPAPNSFIHHPASHDPDVVWTFVEPGTYRVQVRDAASKGGLGADYRLTIRETKPDFWLEVRAPQITIQAGGTANLLAVVHRTGGVHRVEVYKKPDSEIENFRIVELDGWNTPIQVRVEGLPAGVTANPLTAEPKNSEFKGNDGEELFVDGTLVEIPVRVAPDAQPGLYEIRVRGEGIFQGRTVERRARVLYGSLRSLRGEPTFDQKIFLTIVGPPS